MKRYLYVLLLIMSALIVDVCAQTSPTYDDKTPPAFEWGKGKMNAQKQGTPTTGDQEIIANINVTVDNVAERLISETTDKSITDVAEDILEAVSSITADIDLSMIKAEDDVATDTVVSLLREIKNKEAGGDVELSDTNNLISSNTEKLVANVNGSDKSVAELVADVEDAVRHIQLATITTDIESIETVLENNLYDSRYGNRPLYMQLSFNSANEVNAVNSFSEKVKALADTNNDTVMEHLRSVDAKLTYTSDGNSKNVAELVSDVEDAVRHIQLGSMSVDLTDTNNLISSNTEKLSATTTHTVPNYGDDSLNTSSIKSIAEMIAEQLGSTVNMSYYDTDEDGNSYETYYTPTVCRLVSDIGEIINNINAENFNWYLCYPTYNGDGAYSGDEPTLVTTRHELLDGNSISTPVGIASTLMSDVPIEIIATYSRTMTVADGLFTDKEGNPTHVLGRILEAVENGGSGTVGSVSVDLDKIERGVGVLLHEGSEGGKGEVPEMEINLVDMFYDKGTGIGGFDFRGDDSAYLDEGISMYDMTKAGLFGLDEYSNVKPLLKDMLQVSFSADSSMPKMADVVYNIDSKIPQNAIASISQETFSSRIHLGNIYTKLGTLDNRVDRILDALENGSGNKGVTMDTVRYSNGSHGTGDTASVLFDGTLRAVPNFKIDAGPNTSPIKDKTERVFVEFRVPLSTQTFFVGFKNDETHLRPVTGRALFEVGTQDLYIKIPSDSGIDYLWITEGWR